MQQIINLLPNNFEPGNIVLVLIFIGVGLMLLTGLSKTEPKSTGSKSNQSPKDVLNLQDTSIEGFDSYSDQEKVEIIQALKDGTARFGRQKLGKMEFDISTGLKIK